MMSYFTYKLNRIAVSISFYSFIIGTLLFLIKLAFDATVMVGFIFVLVAVVINMILFILLLLNALVNYRDFEENISTIILVILNIPIAFFYLSICF
ncbi:hypothetical protein H0I25_06520 [Cellulophaga sp. HaHa_2_95]|uniref:hypothetical protein n=1 Tax=Cellulophaga sp. HaHa_2_95 TaxID=2745558 RepID=UPI001C4EF011|nr:hypothetical protein [Cellulophaga sp. HaHa_2_95]QXP57437.1 hypothetical protein H0I25_06520 [Cellulophaga sp. HaHa_2_95]